MGLSKQYLGSFAWGFVFIAVLGLLVLFVMLRMQIRWTRTWAEKGGRARVIAPELPLSLPAAARRAQVSS
jgi:NNP family nitrate/nitrite transporter-like MFS transporter